MIDVLRWAMTAELLTLAFLPVTLWAFRALPDAGFAFGKIIALLLVVWVAWWLGLVTGSGGTPLAAWIILTALGVVAWACLGRRALATIRRLGTVAVVEEALFLAAFVAWALMRSFHPDIAGTEKPMDLMLLQSAGHPSISPPQDLWLAGHGVNYYYFGYLLMATVGKLAGTSVFVTFNLALALIFAAAVAGTYSLLYNLTKSRLWAGLGPVLVVLSGNAHGLFLQVLHGQFPWNQAGWYWPSSRVVGPPGTTINEFPIFSLILGDLHPHVMAIPLVLAAITAALAVARERRWNAGPLLVQPARLALFAIIVGSLFAINTWDFPTYLLVCLAALAILCGRDWKALAVTAGIWIASSALAFLPFYLQYHSPATGIGPVKTVTSLPQFAQMFAVFGLLAVPFIIAVAWRDNHFAGALQRMRRGAMGSPSSPSAVPMEARLLLGIGLLAFAAAAVLGRWVLILTGSMMLIAVWSLLHRLAEGRASHTQGGAGPPDEEAGDGFALLLIAAGTLVIAVTELIYLRDTFDGGAYYRMNTVFKFYYQAWILLGLAAGYGSWRVADLLRRRSAEGGNTSRRAWVRAVTGQRRSVWIGIVAAFACVGLVYGVLGSISFYGDQAGGPAIAFQAQDLRGLEWLRAQDSPDYYALAWLRGHVRGTPVILEATGGEYTLFARVSTYTGLPTLLGWEGHEQQWRGSAYPDLARRRALVDQIYSTGSARTAARLMRQAGISLVYVGPCERQVYGGNTPIGTLCPSQTTPSAHDALTKFGRFMAVMYRRDGVTIYGIRTS